MWNKQVIFKLNSDRPNIFLRDHGNAFFVVIIHLYNQLLS
jgi:hypothetical protein